MSRVALADAGRAKALGYMTPFFKVNVVFLCFSVIAAKSIIMYRSMIQF